jgi:hypothetical protein
MRIKIMSKYMNGRGLGKVIHALKEDVKIVPVHNPWSSIYVVVHIGTNKAINVNFATREAAVHWAKKAGYRIS